MIDDSPLVDAIFQTTDRDEERVLGDLLVDIRQGSTFPRHFYISGRQGWFLSENSLEALGKVLRSVEDEDLKERKKRLAEFNKGKGISEEKENSKCQNPKSGVSTVRLTRSRVQMLREAKGKGVKLNVDDGTNADVDAVGPDAVEDDDNGADHEDKVGDVKVESYDDFDYE